MMCNKTITIFLIGMLCLCIASAQAAEVRVEPEYQSVLKGENFSVNITVYPEGNEEIFGTQYDLYFNNTLLNVTSQSKGSFLSHDGVSTNIFTNEFYNTLGKTEYSEARTGVTYGVTIPGVLATITFQVIAEEEGISELRLNKVKISDPNINLIPANVTSGNVSVKIGICGDVTGDDKVNMGDVTKLLWNQTYWGKYPVDPRAADVTGDDKVNMGDVTKLLWNQTYWGEYSLTCC